MRCAAVSYWRAPTAPFAHFGGTQRVKGSSSLPSISLMCGEAASGVSAAATCVSCSLSSFVQLSWLKVVSTKLHARTEVGVDKEGVKRRLR
jgi:hypothetical protein